MKRLALWIGMILAALIGIGLFVWIASPRLLEFSPIDGATGVLAGAPLRLQFDRAMQPESVAAHLIITPARRGNYTWEANTLIFTPDPAWPRGQTITVTLPAGARSTWGLPLWRSQSWSFSVSAPLLAYLWPSAGPANLYALDPFGGEIYQLTAESNGILAYDVSADGVEIIYSSPRAEGGSALYRLDRQSGQTALLLDCPEALCSLPGLSPDGLTLAYQRTPLARQGMTPLPEIWLLPLETGEPRRVSDPAHPCEFPGWSPAGLLTFYDRAAQAFLVLDPDTQATVQFPNETGEPGSWSPDGSAFVASEIFFWGAGGSDFTSHLLQYSYPAASRTDLTSELTLEDASPVFSPDGRRLAFGRKALTAEAWSPGRQLWLMNLGDGAARPLTNSPNDHHADFAWHPGGEYLAFVRYNQAALSEPPSIWLIAVASEAGNPFQLVIDGYAPQWIP